MWQSGLHRVIIVVAAAAITGCGSSRPEGAHLTGMVTLDRAPIPNATIVFRPLEQTTGKSTECKIVNGVFEVKQENGVFGKHRAEIYARHPINPSASAAQTGSLPPGQQPAVASEQYLPAKYNRQSTLTFDIQPGENHIVFDLVSQGR
jgi:hypothetical protein